MSARKPEKKTGRKTGKENSMTKPMKLSVFSFWDSVITVITKFGLWPMQVMAPNQTAPRKMVTNLISAAGDKLTEQCDKNGRCAMINDGAAGR
jgi:hypothetical protein